MCTDVVVAYDCVVSPPLKYNMTLQMAKKIDNLGSKKDDKQG